MASLAQIEANRLNAQHSTGPRSAEGKAATRFNALRHGAHARSLIIPGEDPEAFAQLAAHYRETLNPDGPIEEALVDLIVQADWNTRRYACIETQVWNALAAKHTDDDNPVGAAFLADAAGSNALEKIFRRHQAAQRQWYKARTELRRVQQARADEPKAAPEPVAATKPDPQPVAVPASAPQAASVPAPQPAKLPNPTQGKDWVGSEPAAWRL
jgi:hypothetical protein